MNKWRVLIALLFAAEVFAQEQWTLKDCVAKGVGNSLQFQVAVLHTQVVQTKQQSLGAYFLPEIGVYGTHAYNYGSTIDPSTNNRTGSNISSGQFSVEASVELFNLQNLFTSQRQKLDVDLTQLEEEEVKYRYLLELLIRFYEVLTTQEWLGIQRQQWFNSKDNLERLTKEVMAGAKPQSDLYDIQYVSNRDEISIRETENILYNQKLSLMHWLNVETINPDDFELVVTEEMQGFEDSYRFNPFVEKLLVQSWILNKERQVLKSANLPRLSAKYSFGSFYAETSAGDKAMRTAPFGEQLGDNKSHYVGISLAIPLFQKGTFSRQLKTNKAQLQLNELKLEETVLNLKYQNEEIEREIAQLDVLASIVEKNIVLAQKSFTTTQVKYENGKVDVFSFNQAKNELLNAQFALIKNKLTKRLLQKKRILNNTNSI